MKCENKVIIFTQFVEMAHILIDELKEYNPLLISGEVSSEDRQKVVELFTYDPKYKILVSTDAGAYGLNLQSASYIIMYDLPWSISKLTQREDRAHRIGQTKPVTVYTLVAKETVDEYIVKVLHAKSIYSMDILKDEDRIDRMTVSSEDVQQMLL